LNVNSLSNTKETNWENGFIMLESIAEELKVQGLYELYEKSFLNFWVNFSVWYLESMNTIEAYRNCYQRICSYNEVNKRILNLLENNCYYPHAYGLFKKVVEFELDVNLFERVKIHEKNNEKNGLKGWLFPYEKVKKDGVVVLYGAGAIGKEYYKQLFYTQYCKELYWVDKQFEKLQKKGMNVKGIQILDEIDPDYVVVAVLDVKVQNQVKEDLMNMGIKEDQMVYVY